MQESQTSQKVWTIIELIEWSAKYLNEKGIDDARLNAELLLCHTLNCPRIELYTHFDKPLKQNELNLYKTLFKRRLNYEPLQYITGETEFMGLKFFVDKRVLIPRRDTEILVEQVISQLKNTGDRIDILDIGTGSGNIAVSLAKYLKTSFITAVDVSSDALEVAQINAEKNNVADRIAFRQMDITKDVDFEEKFDAVVSNPPYISVDEYSKVNPEILNYEPKIAATDNSNGLTFHNRIAEVSRNFLRDNGWLFVEIAYNQNEEVTNIFLKNGYKDVEVIKDYSRNYRLVKGHI